MSKRRSFLVILLALIFQTASPALADFLDDFPALKSFIKPESSTHFQLGFGIIPFVDSGSKAGMGVIPFSATVRSSFLEWNFLTASAVFGFLGQGSQNNRVTVEFRTAVKIRITETFSIGPVIGGEFLTFPDISAKLYRNNLASNSEPFSVNGWVVGVIASQNLGLWPNLSLQINESYVLQKYDPVKLQWGWKPVFDASNLNQDPSSLAATPSFRIEICLLY